MTPAGYVLVALASVGAGFLTSTIGFGGAVFLMQIFPLFLPFVQASGLSSLIVYAGILVLAWQYRRHILWKEVWMPSLLYVLSGVPAVFFARTAGTQNLKFGFAVVLILLGIYNLYSVLKAGGLRLPRCRAATAVCSALSGIGTGLFGIGGPPMALYFLSVAGDDKDAYIGTLQGFFSVSMLFTISARFTSGSMPAALLPAALLGMATSLFGKYLGVRMLSRLNVKVMKLCICIFFIFFGIVTAAGCL